MSRYNHRVLEKKWRAIWAEEEPGQGVTTACTVYIPTESVQLDLENLRLLVLADFFGYCESGFQPLIFWIGAGERQHSEAKNLGMRLSSYSELVAPCDLAILPRDFTFLAPDLDSTNKLLCGRFWGQTPVLELLPDFGLDALRVFFLYQGPPTRDYELNWNNLAGAYRFLQKIWRLGQALHHNQQSGDKESLRKLQLQVSQRLKKKKPPAALAAIMEFLRDRTTLSVGELVSIASLLRPYAPFLATELLSRVSALQNDNGGNRN